tara:strand:+ start:2720 stop:3865 length:1146 start_codon:yes stop_codon:yes gene_type:complete
MLNSFAASEVTGGSLLRGRREFFFSQVAADDRMATLNQVVALHAAATSIRKRTAAERKASADLSFRLWVVSTIFLMYLACVPAQVDDAFPEICNWYTSRGGWNHKGKGYNATKPTHASISPPEAIMAASYYTLYRFFGFVYGYKGAMTRRQALFVTEALSDLVFHPGFTGIQYCGSAKQLKRDKATYFLGISPDVPALGDRVDRWFEKDNPLACLYTSRAVLSTNFAWNEAYKTAKVNDGSIDGTYMASLFDGGVLNVAIEQVASEGDTNIHAYLHKLYGGSTYLKPKKCPAQGEKLAITMGIAVAGIVAGCCGGGGEGAEASAADEGMTATGMAKTAVLASAAGTGAYYAGKKIHKLRKESYFKKKWNAINTCTPYESPD